MSQTYCQKCIDILLPSLTKLVNLSLQNGIFQNPFKQAIVTPLLKKSTLSKEDLKSYRPVSGLSLSKLVECIVADQIRSHLDCHDLGNTFQSAYKVGHSTETALLCMKMRFIYLCPRACLQHWCCSTYPQPSILSVMTQSFPVCQLGLVLLVLLENGFNPTSMIVFSQSRLVLLF